MVARIAEVSSAAGWDYRVVVVDDGSRDGTGDLARAMASRGVPIEVLRNEPNQGLGYTIRRALRHASEQAAPGDAIITLDADLTQDPAYAPEMLAKLAEGYDVVIASRYRPGSGVEGVPPHRVLLSYGASGLMALVRPVHGIRDFSCGFRVYRAQIIQRGFAEYGDAFVSERGFACMVEIAQRLRPFASFAEVPFVLRYDEKRKGSEIRILPTIRAYLRVIGNVAKAERRPIPVSVLAVAATSVLLGSIAQLLLRHGAGKLGDMSVVATLAAAFASPAVAPWVIGGLAVYSVSSLLWLGVLSRMPLALAYPLGAGGYVFVAALAAADGEPVGLLRWLGVVLIALGVLLVGWLGFAPVKRVGR